MRNITTYIENRIGFHPLNIIIGSAPAIVFFLIAPNFETIATAFGIPISQAATTTLLLLAVTVIAAVWRLADITGITGRNTSLPPAEPNTNLWVKEVETALTTNRALLDFYAPRSEYTSRVDGITTVDDKAREDMVRLSIVGISKLDQGDDETDLSALTPYEKLEHYKRLPKAFTIALATNGEAEKKVEAFADNIKSAMNLYSVEVDRDDNPYGSTVSFICHSEKVEVRDLLFESRFGSEFFEENPCVNPMLIPLGITKDNQVWSLPLHHTLIAGATGSGKGSVVQGIIRQLAPFVIKGEALLYGADPKNAELPDYKNSFLFERVAIQPEEIDALIREVHERMTFRQQFIGRSFKPSTESPVIVLLIDELASYYKKAVKRDKDIPNLLFDIMNLGRSAGVYLVGASQKLSVEILGQLRDGFENIITLRIKASSPHFIDVAHGEGSAESGVRPDLIPPAKPANGYASSGLAYASDENGEVSYMRFAYTSDEDLAQLIKDTWLDNGEQALERPAVI